MAQGGVAGNFLWEVGQNITQSVRLAIPENVQEHLQLTHEAYISTIQTIKLWALVFYPVLQGILWIIGTIAGIVMPLLPPLWERTKGATIYLWNVFLEYGWPRIVDLFQSMAHSRLGRKLLEADPATIGLVLIAFGTIVTTVWTVRWFIRQGYISRAKNSVANRWWSTKTYTTKFVSGLHTSVFHLMIVLHAVLCIRYAPQVMEATAHPVIFWVTAVIIPAYYTFNLLHDIRAEGMLKEPWRLRKWLVYWVVIASMAVVLLMPFMMTIVGKFWHINVLRVHFAFWLWFSRTDGAEVIYGLLVPVVNRFIRQLPTAPTAVSDENKGSLRKLLGMVTTEQVKWAVDWIIDTGPAIMISFLFFLTPGFVTAYGAIFVGMVYPIYCSIFALETTPTKTPNAKVKVIPDTPYTPGPGRQRSQIPVRPDIKWLVYWAAFAPVKMCMESLTPVFGQLPLWNHLELFIILWLLIKGANFIVKEVDHLTHRAFWAQRDREERMREYEAEVAGNSTGGKERVTEMNRADSPSGLLESSSLTKRLGSARRRGDNSDRSGNSSALGTMESPLVRAEDSVTPLHPKDRDGVARKKSIPKSKDA